MEKNNYRDINNKLPQAASEFLEAIKKNAKIYTKDHIGELLEFDNVNNPNSYSFSSKTYAIELDFLPFAECVNLTTFLEETQEEIKELRTQLVVDGFDPAGNMIMKGKLIGSETIKSIDFVASDYLLALVNYVNKAEHSTADNFLEWN